MKKFLSYTNILILIITFLFFGDLILLLGSGEANDILIKIHTQNEQNEEIVIETTLGECEKVFEELGMPFTKESFIATQVLIAGGFQGPIMNKLGIIDNRIDPNGHNIIRRFTVLFTHAGVLHLLVNMIALFIIGNFLEKKIKGHWVLILIFIISFLSTYLTDFLMSLIDKSFIIGQTTELGASGGVFGLMGCALALCIINKPFFKELSLFKKIILAFYGIFFTYLANGSFVSWTMIAHNSGFIIGFVIMYILIKKIPKKIYKQC